MTFYLNEKKYAFMEQNSCHDALLVQLGAQNKLN
jgi:hypothetical protein